MSESNKNTVLYEENDGVAVIRLNRPHVKNAINKEMHRDLYDAFDRARKADDVKVILLTGQENSFSSGADIKSIPIDEMESFDHGEYLRDTYNKLILLIDSIEKPVVAHLNGTAVGAGLSIALACDYRVASDDAKLALSFFGIGLTPDAGASYFLPRLVGLSKAMEIALGGPLSAKEALEVGLIHRIGDPNPLVESLKQAPAPAFAWMKKNMKAGCHLPLDQVLELEVEGQRQAGKSKAHFMAVSKFIKR
ncbi:MULTISPECIES: enoyl-CoA hydratase/isomerase family protein [Bacillaceae]|uniref:Enoyl-CoA hydratase/isomerase family protein n=1 Tax=Evansella alkalicola TaxID=745819 RepID=A0ABS6K0C7_9BACI|nr:MULTISPECIES: enoyl-CoA hydratase/isomerase family protein [Bacillaceae]MBU9724299.1 enoyl-CoA hydratase/isomerase family protein [Bacillus alkalicola]